MRALQPDLLIIDAASKLIDNGANKNLKRLYSIVDAKEGHDRYYVALVEIEDLRQIANERGIQAS
ncbi:6888_t:CDS:2 [Ambispora leptoticha]|uniref:6888_t:CDS:1 n=1 Tax=Ambispora leptoticha TaxID=144679 RepID=A0A9N8WLR7_9GLOM|nr:6888_t:CDS:2 [Ambispora leptoticha]